MIEDKEVGHWIVSVIVIFSTVLLFPWAVVLLVKYMDFIASVIKL